MHLNLMVVRDEKKYYFTQGNVFSVIFVHSKYFQAKRGILGKEVVLCWSLSAKMSLSL